MADVADVVDGVQIGPACVIVQILPFAADDVKRFGVGDTQRFADMLLPGGEDGLSAQAACVWQGEAEGSSRCLLVNSGELLERRPGGSLRDGQVLVLRVLAHLVGRDSYAHAQPHHDEIINQFGFQPGKRVDLVVAAHDVGCGREQRGCVEDDVGGGDSRFGDGVCLDEVTKIDNPHKRCRLRAGVIHDDVVLVTVVVNDARSKLRGVWGHCRFELADETFEESAAFRILDVLQVATHDRGGVP